MSAGKHNDGGERIDALHRDVRDQVTEVKLLDIELHKWEDEISTIKRVWRSRAGAQELVSSRIEKSG